MKKSSFVGTNMDVPSQLAFLWFSSEHPKWLIILASMQGTPTCTWISVNRVRKSQALTCNPLPLVPPSSNILNNFCIFGTSLEAICHLICNQICIIHLNENVNLCLKKSIQYIDPFPCVVPHTDAFPNVVIEGVIHGMFYPDLQPR